VKRLEGRPFALLGVNSDGDREAVRQLMASKGLNWRSWWDHGGRIARRWKVDRWPTMYVLDAQGVVRYRVSGAAELDRAVEKLLGEAEGS
jgi:AhpC/TSA family